MNERLEEMNNKLVLIIGWELENVAHVSSHLCISHPLYSIYKRDSNSIMLVHHTVHSH